MAFTPLNDRKALIDLKVKNLTLFIVDLFTMLKQIMHQLENIDIDTLFSCRLYFTFLDAFNFAFDNLPQQKLDDAIIWFLDLMNFMSDALLISNLNDVELSLASVKDVQLLHRVRVSFFIVWCNA